MAEEPYKYFVDSKNWDMLIFLDLQAKFEETTIELR